MEKSAQCLFQFLVLTSLLMVASSQQQSYAHMMTSLHKLLNDPQQYAQPDIKSRLNLKTQYESLTTQLQDLDTSYLNEILEAGENISKICLAHLKMTLQALEQKQEWALRMLDATAKVPAGLLNGNIFWMGAYDECVNVTSTVFTGPNFTMPTHPFKGRYCKAGISLGQEQSSPINAGGAIPLGDLSIGLCVPSSCSAEDVKAIANAVIGLVPQSVRGNLSVGHSVCQFDELEYDARAIISILVLSILAGIMVAGTAYDVFVIHKLHISTELEPDTEETAPLIVSPSNNHSEASRNIKYRGGYGSAEASSGLLDGEVQQTHIQKTDEIGIGTMGKILQAFSVYTNGSKLLSTNTQAGMLGSVNGIRFLSLSWVILGHSYVFPLFNTKNTFTFILEKMNSLSFMFMVNATVSVDSFFTLSGLLVSYLTLKELKKVGGVKNFKWGMFYFHRFWRLTPPFMLVMLLYIPLLKYWYNGPFWPQNGTEKNYCEDSWWKSLLYIQNFFKTVDTCMAWAWYLANDMQFYVISPLLLIPLYYSSVLGVLVCFLMLLACWISAGVISSANDLPMSALGFGGGGPDPDHKRAGMAFDELYVRPYARIGPYVVGMLFGYLLYKTDCRARMSRLQNLTGWLLAAGGCLSVLYANYGTISGKHVSSKEIIALYTAVHRSVWGFGISWIIYACATGYGGIVNTFLSWKAFIPLSRLTYLAYLIHPVIMICYFNGKRDAIYLNDFEAVYFFFGNLVATNAIAFVLSLAFESPFMGLEKAIFKRERRH